MSGLQIMIINFINDAHTYAVAAEAQTDEE